MKKTNRRIKKSKSKKTLKRKTFRVCKCGKSPCAKSRKPRKAKAPALTEEQKAEAQALADFNAEIRLSVWKSLKKTWTKGKTARFKAQKYVKDLAARIKNLDASIGGEKEFAVS